MYRGFDTYSFPGVSVMSWLKANTDLSWTGLYLSHAPSMPDKSWIGAYKQIARHWGIAPIYVGSQCYDGRPDHRTPMDGVNEANEAITFARAAGIDKGRVLFLDIETGGTQSKTALSYITAWLDQITLQGYAAGIYCSYLTLDQISRLGPKVVPWVWRLTINKNILLRT